MGNIFNDLNKLVNTVQKVDKILTQKPKVSRKRKPSFDTLLRNLIEHILSQPQDVQRKLEKEVVDNLNELHHSNSY